MNTPIHVNNRRWDIKGTRFDVSWSPDSKWIMTNICDLRNGNKMYLLNWSIDSLYRPKLLSYYRGSPGDTNMVYMIPVLFEIESGLFASERSGWRQLYTLDLKTKVVTHLTEGEYYVNDVIHIDENMGIVYFTASGKEPGANPYQQYLYKVSIEKNELKLLTPEKFNHDISFSPYGKYFTDNYSTAQQPTTTILRESSTGNVVTELGKADISAIQALNWTAPQIFTAIARDGKTEIYGALWKPTNFNPNKKYPIIDNSYTGPHTQMFPRNFTRVLAINNQALSELGFAVMMVDGLGSSGRSKAFHDVSYKNLGF